MTTSAFLSFGQQTVCCAHQVLLCLFFSARNGLRSVSASSSPPRACTAAASGPTALAAAQCKLSGYASDSIPDVLSVFRAAPRERQMFAHARLQRCDAKVCSATFVQLSGLRLVLFETNILVASCMPKTALLTATSCAHFAHSEPASVVCLSRLLAVQSMAVPQFHGRHPCPVRTSDVACGRHAFMRHMSALWQAQRCCVRCCELLSAPDAHPGLRLEGVCRLFSSSGPAPERATVRQSRRWHPLCYRLGSCSLSTLCSHVRRSRSSRRSVPTGSTRPDTAILTTIAERLWQMRWRDGVLSGR